jgi:hypothetical protein
MMSLLYPIEDIPANAPEDVEDSGSKYKFWFGGGRFLFKAGPITNWRSGADPAQKSVVL